MILINEQGERSPAIKVVFIQNIWREYYGVMSLSACLREAGHETAVIIDHIPERASAKALEHDPDIAAFSFTNCERSFALETAEKIKDISPNTLAIAGGADPSLDPGIAQRPAVDLICRGEGERAFPQVAAALDSNEEFYGIAGISGNGFSNPPGRLVENLDSLPFPDRSIYYEFGFLRTNPVKFFFTGRGCPYSCSFCFNKSLRNLYPNKNRYVRHHSPGRVIREILDVKRRYGLKVVRFEDDVLTVNKKWLLEFLGLYKSEVTLPFVCYIRAGIDEETVSALKEADCYCAMFGIETGDEYRRNDLLHKNLKDGQIHQTARLLSKYRIHFFTTNIFGLPSETFDHALKTVRINQDIGAKDCWAAVFQPYSGLELTEKAVMSGELSSEKAGEVGHNTFDSNELALSDADRIFNLHKLFYPLVRWPWLEPLLIPLTRLPRNPVFHYIFVFFYVVSYRQHTGVGFRRLIDEGVHWFRVFLGEKTNRD